MAGAAAAGRASANAATARQIICRALRGANSANTIVSPHRGPHVRLSGTDVSIVYRSTIDRQLGSETAMTPAEPRTDQELLWARNRGETLQEASAWNDVLATILSHRSVRAYAARPLPGGTLDLLIAAAQSASTSSNLQTWSVVAVENPERKDRLSEL